MQFRTHPPRHSSEYTPWLMCAFIALVLILCSSLHGCATQPKGTTQTVYAAGWTLVGATNSVADLHQSGVLKGADYQRAKDILQQAEAAYKQSRDALASGNPTNATTHLNLAQQLLLQLSAFLQGVK